MTIDLEYFDTFSSIIGCDEVGRGPIAGPVNACAVCVDKDHADLISFLIDLGVTDSKKLTQKRRLHILEQLKVDLHSLKVNTLYDIKLEQHNFSFVLSELSASEIDKLNILKAALTCMQISSEKLMQNDAIVLVDGNKTFESSAKHIEAIVKGDSKSAIIALASIIAKEYRDNLMAQYDKEFPGYGLAKHAGYPTAAHKKAVVNLGVTSIHRKTFKGVKEYV